MAKLCIINTRGTISSVGTPLGPMSAKAFGDASTKILNPILAEKFPDDVITYETDLVFPESTKGTLDSTNLQPTDWCLMAAYILDNYDKYDGFIILHGTDSMAFTGSALPFLLNCVDKNGQGTAVLSKPVIITGSQVPMYYKAASGGGDLKLNFNTDAFQNFCGAITCARFGIPEVGVYFDTELYRGNRVIKVNASEFQAFNTPNYPAQAKIGIELTLFDKNTLPGPAQTSVSLDNSSALQLAKDQVTAVKAAVDNFPVMQFNAVPAWYNASNSTAMIAKLIDACVGAGIKGLVLESYGEGNFPSGDANKSSDGAIFKSLKSANDAGVVILNCTQVIAGVVNSSAYASGAWLPSVGAIASADMTAIAGFAKTTVLLAAAAHNKWSAADVKKLIQLDLQGEVLSTSRLDSRTNAVLMDGQSLSALDGSARLTMAAATGPVLKSSSGDVLWQPLKTTAKSIRLVMQSDGNLVVYDPNSEPLWATQTPKIGAAYSQMIIDGSFAAKTLRLFVLNYLTGDSKELYSQ